MQTITQPTVIWMTLLDGVKTCDIGTLIDAADHTVIIDSDVHHRRTTYLDVAVVEVKREYVRHVNPRTPDTMDGITAQNFRYYDVMIACERHWVADIDDDGRQALYYAALNMWRYLARSIEDGSFHIREWKTDW